MKNRYDYIDSARGLAMMSVVIWHALNIHTPWTDAWTMPIFFIIMGLFYKPASSFNDLLKKKINQLIIPVLFFSIPSLIILFATIPFVDVIKKILNPYQCVNGFSWFLWCTFWCYLLYYMIDTIAKRNMKHKAIIVLIISLIGFYTSRMHLFGYRIVLPMFLSTAMFCLVFIFIGELIKSRVLLKYSSILLGG